MFMDDENAFGRSSHSSFLEFLFHSFKSCNHRLILFILSILSSKCIVSQWIATHKQTPSQHKLSAFNIKEILIIVQLIILLFKIAQFYKIKWKDTGSSDHFSSVCSLKANKEYIISVKRNSHTHKHQPKWLLDFSLQNWMICPRSFETHFTTE